MRTDHYKTPKEFARLLRKNLTPEEAIMWDLVRNRKILGYKFLRQHPLKVWETYGGYHYYYADFYCAEKKLVVEIDGLIHCLQEDYDKSRDQLMLELKLSVLRFTNNEVNEDLIMVLKRITQLLNSSPGPFSIS